jgi:pyruvate/2-oxoacid:ferredoxin oxidoreductase alpha subunit
MHQDGGGRKMSEKRVGMEVSIAMAEAVKLANVDCISAYPITPQTHIVEHLSELVADGGLDAEFIPVESEHSALSVCAGTSAVGARTFTATSSQGFALMHEILFIVAGMRLPIVMALANRALSAAQHGTTTATRWPRGTAAGSRSLRKTGRRFLTRRFALSRLRKTKEC